MADRVIVRLKGGLGNQLFQLAAGRSLAEKLGAELLTFARGGASPLTRELGIELTDLSVDVAEEVGLAPATGVRRIASSIGRRLRSKRGDLLVLRQPEHTPFAPMAIQIPSAARTVVLDGYFQHPTWFEPALPGIVGAMLAALPLESVPDNGCVLSFRRGDYVPLGWALPWDYYEAALERIGAIDGSVWLVGDDPMVLELVADRLEGRGIVCSDAPAMKGSSMQRDLALIAASTRLIMSNSTFCWWGAVAGSTTGVPKRTVAPRDWVSMGDGSCLLRPQWTAVGVPSTA